MTAMQVTIHGIGKGDCILSGRPADGLTISFQDGIVMEGFLGWKAFRQLLALRAVQQSSPSPKLSPGGEAK